MDILSLWLCFCVFYPCSNIYTYINSLICSTPRIRSYVARDIHQMSRKLDRGKVFAIEPSAKLFNESLHMWHTYNTCGGHVSPFQDQRSKVKVIRVVSSFGLARSVALSLFGWITSYMAFIQHEGTMCHAPFPGWKVKGQGHSKFLKCPLRGFLLIA